MRFGCELADWRFVRLNACVTRRCLVVPWVVPVSPWVSWVWFGPVSGCFRHAGVCVCFQWFWGCSCGSGLRVCRCWCKFSLAARHGVLPLGAGASGPVRWWFENSRACLYYFMQVNDCQSAVRFPLGSGRGALKVGGVFVR